MVKPIGRLGVVSGGLEGVDSEGDAYTGNTEQPSFSMTSKSSNVTTELEFKIKRCWIVIQCANDSRHDEITLDYSQRRVGSRCNSWLPRSL